MGGAGPTSDRAGPEPQARGGDRHGASTSPAYDGDAAAGARPRRRWSARGMARTASRRRRWVAWWSWTSSAPVRRSRQGSRCSPGWSRQLDGSDPVRGADAARRRASRRCPSSCRGRSGPSRRAGCTARCPPCSTTRRLPTTACCCRSDRRFARPCTTPTDRSVPSCCNGSTRVRVRSASRRRLVPVRWGVPIAPGSGGRRRAADVGDEAPVGARSAPTAQSGGGIARVRTERWLPLPAKPPRRAQSRVRQATSARTDARGKCAGGEANGVAGGLAAASAADDGEAHPSSDDTELSVEGLGLADLLAGALAAYRAI